MFLWRVKWVSPPRIASKPLGVKPPIRGKLRCRSLFICRGAHNILSFLAIDRRFVYRRGAHRDVIFTAPKLAKNIRKCYIYFFRMCGRSPLFTGHHIFFPEAGKLSPANVLSPKPCQVCGLRYDYLSSILCQADARSLDYQCPSQNRGPPKNMGENFGFHHLGDSFREPTKIVFVPVGFPLDIPFYTLGQMNPEDSRPDVHTPLPKSGT